MNLTRQAKLITINMTCQASSCNIPFSSPDSARSAAAVAVARADGVSLLLSEGSVAGRDALGAQGWKPARIRTGLAGRSAADDAPPASCRRMHGVGLALCNSQNAAVIS